MTKERSSLKSASEKNGTHVWANKHIFSMLRDLEGSGLRRYVFKTLAVNGILPTQKYRSVIQRIHRILYPDNMKEMLPEHRTRQVDAIIKEYFQGEL